MRSRPKWRASAASVRPRSTSSWVAAGRYDGFWESGLKPWDIAAGILLVREAGGFVTDFRGADRALERGEILAANDTLHSRLHKLVGTAVKAQR
jgi:myo-inositol-1(or 4)-monophosphatase